MWAHNKRTCLYKNGSDYSCKPVTFEYITLHNHKKNKEKYHTRSILNLTVVSPHFCVPKKKKKKKSASILMQDTVTSCLIAVTDAVKPQARDPEAVRQCYLGVKHHVIFPACPASSCRQAEKQILSFPPPICLLLSKQRQTLSCCCKRNVEISYVRLFCLNGPLHEEDPANQIVRTSQWRQGSPHQQNTEAHMKPLLHL